MCNRRWSFTVLTLSMLLFAAEVGRAQEAAGHPAGVNTAQMKFGTVPNLPTCATGAVQSGDPMKAAFIIYARFAAGCSIPWHWHSANENLMIVTGTAHLQSKGEKTWMLKAGGFAMLPSHHVHQFSCPAQCSIYLYSDGAFDIHYVNADGAEIAASDALKPFKETAAVPPK